MIEHIDKYISLVESYLGNRITVQEFECSYLECFSNEIIEFPEHIYNLLNELFLDIEAFCSDSSMRGEGDMNENDLRKVCGKSLDDLTKVRGIDSD